MIRIAATPNRKPSASAFAPFSIALGCGSGKGSGEWRDGRGGHVPSFGEWSDMLVCWFTKQVGTKFDFRPVHALREVHAYRPERRVSAGKERTRVRRKDGCMRGEVERTLWLES